MAEVTKVSKEAIEKAEIALGLKKANDIAEDKADELKKAEEAKAAIEKEYADVLQKAQDLKAKLEGNTTATKDVIEKAETTKPFDTATFEKAITDKLAGQFEALGTLIKAKDESIEALSTKLEKAEEFNAVLGKRLGILEKQPLDRKSVTTTDFLEKGGADKGKKDEGTVMSLGNKAHRAQVADLLLEKALEDKEKGNSDSFFKKAVTYVELNEIPDTATGARIQKFLKDEHKIVLTK